MRIMQYIRHHGPQDVMGLDMALRPATLTQAGWEIEVVWGDRKLCLDYTRNNLFVRYDGCDCSHSIADDRELVQQCEEILDQLLLA